eukprot:751594-Hanusia_phi.AAC.1
MTGGRRSERRRVGLGKERREERDRRSRPHNKNSKMSRPGWQGAGGLHVHVALSRFSARRESADLILRLHCHERGAGPDDDAVAIDVLAVLVLLVLLSVDGELERPAARSAAGGGKPLLLLVDEGVLCGGVREESRGYEASLERRSFSAVSVTAFSDSGSSTSMRACAQADQPVIPRSSPACPKNICSRHEGRGGSKEARQRAVLGEEIKVVVCQVNLWFCPEHLLERSETLGPGSFLDLQAQLKVVKAEGRLFIQIDSLDRGEDATKIVEGSGASGKEEEEEFQHVGVLEGEAALKEEMEGEGRYDTLNRASVMSCRCSKLSKPDNCWAIDEKTARGSQGETEPAP